MPSKLVSVRAQTAWVGYDGLTPQRQDRFPHSIVVPLSHGAKHLYRQISRQNTPFPLLRYAKGCPDFRYWGLNCDSFVPNGMLKRDPA